MSSKLRKRLRTDSLGFSDCHTGTNQPVANPPPPTSLILGGLQMLINKNVGGLQLTTTYPQCLAAFSDWADHPAHFRSHHFLKSPHPRSPPQHHHTPPPLHPSIQLPLMAALLLFRWLCATRYLACSMTHVCCCCSFGVAKQECLMDGSSRYKRLRHVAELMWYK